MAGRQRDKDADTGRHVRAPEAVLGLMRAVGRAAGAADIAAFLGRKPKQTASAAGALDDAGLVVRRRAEPKRLGRGNLRPTAAMADAGRPKTQDAYLSLSRLLLEVLADGHDPSEAGRMAGMLIGKAARSDDSSAPDDALVQVEKILERQGFMPKQIGRRPEIGFVLGRCPYEQAALANPGLVCGLHRAMTEGMLEALGGAFEMANLVARHPTTAGCRLKLRAVGQPD